MSRRHTYATSSAGAASQDRDAARPAAPLDQHTRKPRGNLATVANRYRGIGPPNRRKLTPKPLLRERGVGDSGAGSRCRRAGRAAGGPCAGLLVVTAVWTGARWGELTGLRRVHFLYQRTTRGRKLNATTPGTAMSAKPAGE
jgi:hypothetical protein